MQSVLTAAYFQSDMERLLEKILETGMPLEMEYKGKKFLISMTEAYDSETNFWENKSLEQILQTTSVPPVSDIYGLVSDSWPEDESADDIIKNVYQQRKEDMTE
ncbi:MAG: hypothetical protein B6245_09055 [Desulfobacteraceae bacterium 4572_88]|nr:MAG: hypothetical protein B6245_09055 [Desulfobacteraceae bacterium 4572_88]